MAVFGAGNERQRKDQYAASDTKLNGVKSLTYILQGMPVLRWQLACLSIEMYI